MNYEIRTSFFMFGYQFKFIKDEMCFYFFSIYEFALGYQISFVMYPFYYDSGCFVTNSSSMKV